MKQYKCPKCGNVFQEKLDKCPTCGVAFNYPKEEENVEPEVIEAVDVEVIDEPVIHVEMPKPSEDDERDNKRTMTAFVLSLISLFTGFVLFPLSIAALCVLAGTNTPRRHPHRTFYRVAKPVGIVGCVLGPIVIAAIIVVVIVCLNFAKEHPEAVHHYGEFVRLFVK